MNAIAPVPHFQPSSNASQTKPDSDSNSSGNAVGGQDFSRTLHAENNKPTRKSADRSGQRSQGGNPPPAGGNPPPSALPPASQPQVALPPVSPPPVTNAKLATLSPSGPGTPGLATAPTTAAATAIVAATAAAATGAATAVQAGSPTTSQNSTAPGAVPVDSGDAAAPPASLADQNPAPVTAQSLSPTTAATSSAPPEAGVPPLVLPPDATTPADTNSADAAVSSAAAALAATAADATTSAAAAAAAAAAQAAAAVTAPPTATTDAIAHAAAATPTRPSSPSQGNQPTHAIRSSALDPNASATSGGDATTATDSTAQTAVAAAAAARAVTATDSNDPASQDQLAIPDIGPKPGVAAPTNLPPVAAASAGSRAAITTEVSAAVANARAINALANANSAIDDKTSRDSNSDSPLASVSSDGSVGAAQLLTTNTTTDASTTTTFKVAAPVESSEFSQGVADRVSFMVDGNISSAKLQVNPPALGPIEVHIALQGSHAQVSFTSHSALTRDALESSAPKLREMLGSQGFGQVSVDVSHGSFQDRSAQSSPYQGSAVRRDTGVSAVQATARSNARVATGVLDAYA